MNHRLIREQRYTKDLDRLGAAYVKKLDGFYRQVERARKDESLLRDAKWRAQVHRVNRELKAISAEVHALQAPPEFGEVQQGVLAAFTFYDRAREICDPIPRMKTAAQEYVNLVREGDALWRQANAKRASLSIGRL